MNVFKPPMTPENSSKKLRLKKRVSGVKLSFDQQSLIKTFSQPLFVGVDPEPIEKKNIKFIKIKTTTVMKFKNKK